MRDWKKEIENVADEIKEKAGDITLDLNNVIEIEIKIHLRPDEVANFDVIKNYAVPFVEEV